jgi:hypothetical protein
MIDDFVAQVGANRLWAAIDRSTRRSPMAASAPREVYAPNLARGSASFFGPYQTNRRNQMTHEQEIKSTTSPTFIARFEDGQVTRMTAYCENGKLDLKRSIALARAAYEKRAGKPPPSIVAAKFVELGYNDTMLKEYDAKALGEALTKQQNRRRR